MTPVRVLIADDHELVRYALRTLLDGEDDIVVVGEAADGEMAVQAVGESTPDVVLLDLHMPRVDGVEACRRVKERHPDVSVLVLTSFDDDEEIFSVLDAGANGYILKTARPDRLVGAVRAVADGQSVFDAGVANRIVAGRVSQSASTVADDPLSDREMDVLRLMAEGMSNREIGRALWIGESTVKTHVSHILRKLGQGDRTAAVLTAVRVGLVRLGSQR